MTARIHKIADARGGKSSALSVRHCRMHCSRRLFHQRLPFANVGQSARPKRRTTVAVRRRWTTSCGAAFASMETLAESSADERPPVPAPWPAIGASDMVFDRRSRGRRRANSARSFALRAASRAMASTEICAARSSIGSRAKWAHAQTLSAVAGPLTPGSSPSCRMVVVRPRLGPASCSHCQARRHGCWPIRAHRRHRSASNWRRTPVSNPAWRVQLDPPDGTRPGLASGAAGQDIVDRNAFFLIAIFAAMFAALVDRLSQRVTREAVAAKPKRAPAPGQDR